MLSPLEGGVGQLNKIEVYETDVTLKMPIKAAHGTHQILKKIYVRLVGSQGVGWGEIAALETPVGRDPSLVQVVERLTSHWVPLVAHVCASRGGQAPASQGVVSLGGTTIVDQHCAAALEMAFLDAELRCSDLALSQWLNGSVNDVAFGGLIGVGTVSEQAEKAQQLLGEGASRLRVKVTPESAYEALSALRSEHPEVALHADANGSFTLSEIEILQSLDDFALVCLEQPLASGDLTEFATLAHQLKTPLCLDESVTSRRAGLDALRYGAASVLCVKPGRVGGLRPSLALCDLARSHGAEVFMGGMFETGLGRAFLGALAARPEVGLISDVAAPCTYLNLDPCNLEGPSGNRQPLWTTPGVGPWPDINLLRQISEFSF